MLPFRFMVPNYLTLYLYRSLAAVERLALQESHFNNFHNLAPYFVLLCFSRLQSVYIVPLELKNDIDFFCSCTVSYVSTTFSFVPFFNIVNFSFFSGNLCIVCFLTSSKLPWMYFPCLLLVFTLFWRTSFGLSITAKLLRLWTVF